LTHLASTVLLINFRMKLLVVCQVQNGKAPEQQSIASQQAATAITDKVHAFSRHSPQTARLVVKPVAISQFYAVNPAGVMTVFS